MLRLSKLVLVVLSVGLLFVLPVSADTIEANFHNVLNQANVQYTLTGGALSSSTVAGFFSFTKTGGTFPFNPLPGETDANFLAFCIEIGETITPGSSHTWSVDELDKGRTQDPPGELGEDRAEKMRTLFAVAFPNGILTSGVSAVAAAAIQISIWEIAYEADLGALDLTTGNTKFSGNVDVVNTAQGLLSQINNGSNLRAQELYSMNKLGTQDFVIQLFNAGNMEVPEPSTFALLGMSLALFALGRLRRTA